MANYDESTVPTIKNAGLSAQLTDIDNGSKIDVIRLLGRPAKKIIINALSSQTISIDLNTAKRTVGPFIDGVVDVDGNESDLPAFGYAQVNSETGLATKVVGADNVSDRAYNIWGGNGLAISVSTGTPAIWNSFDSYGEMDITSVEFSLSGGLSEFTCTFIA